MKEAKRYIQAEITEDLLEKMVFIGGPRQVGKTTLVRNIGRNAYQQALYLNWDHFQDRRKILKYNFESEMDLLILDEIHKYRPWKRHVKGIYDTMKERFDILVTGSARLDVYRKGGDSLQGRYNYYRLHPLSVAEICNSRWNGKTFNEIEIKEASPQSAEAFSNLMTFGGFPEPFFKQSERTLRRWAAQRVERLVREDIRDLEAVRDLSLVEVLATLLPERAGSSLSVNSLREDLQLAHKTVESWLSIFERMYYTFSLKLFSASTIRSLRKEKKLYLWDWSEINEPGHKFENLVASHLLKFVHYLTDYDGQVAELFYIRDRDKREVDFLVTIKRKPWFCLEVKSSDTEPSQQTLYFKERLKIPHAYQLVGTEGVDLYKKGVRIVSASKFLNSLI